MGDWLHPYAVYDFTLTRERDGPREFLGGFSGYLQADAYSGYDCISRATRFKRSRAGFNRGYWRQARDNDPVRANTALSYHRDGEAFTQAANDEPVKSDELDSLLPDRWLQAHSEHVWTIDEIRREERKRNCARLAYD